MGAMTDSRISPWFRRSVAAALAAALVVLAPGIAPYEAAAQVLNGASSSVGRAAGVSAAAASRSGAIRIVPSGAALVPALNFASALTPGAAPAAIAPAAAAVPALPASAVASGAAAVPASSVRSALAAAADAAKPNAAGQLSALQTAADGLRDESAKAGLFDRFYSGMRRMLGFETAAVSGGAIAAASAPRLAPASKAAAAPKPVDPLAARAAPPAPVRLEGKGLQPGEPFLKSDKSDDEFSPETKTALAGMTGARLFSLVAASISGVAWPMLLSQALGGGAVGDSRMLMQNAIGGLIGIVIGLMAGKAGDKFPLKKYTIFNFGLRSALTLVNSVFLVAGGLNFWTLLGLSVISSWQYATLYINDAAVMTSIVGSNKHKLRSTEALIRFATIIATVFSGMFLTKRIIDGFGLVWAFNIVAALQAVATAIMWKTLPDSLDKARAAASAAAAPAVRWLDAVRSKIAALTARDAAFYAASALMLGASVYACFVPIAAAPFLLGSPLPMVAVVAWMLWRSDAYQNVISKHPLFKASLMFVMMGAFIEQPLRNSVFKVLAGATDLPGLTVAGYSGLMLASFYMGQMPSATGVLDSKLAFTVAGRAFNLRETMKYVGIGLMSIWSYTSLVPKTWLAGLAASAGVALPASAAAALGAAIVIGTSAGAYLALHHISANLSDRAWMRWESASLVLIGLPLFFGMASWSVLLSLASLGYALNGSQRLLSALFSSQAFENAPNEFQYINGMKGSFVNMATSLAVAIYGAAKDLPQRWGGHSFPFLWQVITGIFTLFAAFFLRASYTMPLDGKKGGEKKTS